jgi:glycosyltransferase involved in cell wall biosynthesis
VITVADNQERKNIPAGFQTLSILKEKGVSVKHILVTREHSMVGWKLYDLAYMDDINLSSELRVFQSGMEFKDLYMLYCASDAYLSCSKGEGLGVPVMEAMSVGVPVVANNTGAIPELLANGRGLITDYKFWHYDPFGNQRRYFIDINKAADNLLKILHGVNTEEYINTLASARKYMESRNWDRPAQQINNFIQSASNEA